MNPEELQEAYYIINKEFDELLIIARELAAKHIKGNIACTACAAVKYMGGVEHNSGCPVLRLEKFK